MSPIINQLFIYPIKSCAGIAVQNFQFDHKGPLLDRRWMLVDASNGQFLSQRDIAKMALISTVIDDGVVYAKQSFNSSIADTLRLPVNGLCVDVQVWEDDVQGLDCGDAAANWFSELLDFSCRLIYQGEHQRLADAKYTETDTQVSFADGFPLLVVAQSSIDALNAKCNEVRNTAKNNKEHESERCAVIGAENFRPNIVVANTRAFSEALWLSLVAEQEAGVRITMPVVKRCQRCVIPLLNVKTAKRESAILPVLLKYCRVDEKIYFGQNLTFNIEGDGVLSVGQRLDIYSK